MATDLIRTDDRCTHAECHSTQTEVVTLVRPDYLVEQVPTIDEKRTKIPLCANHADEWRARDEAGKITPKLIWD